MNDWENFKKDLRNFAKQNHKKCNGQGYIGYEHKTGKPIPCRCAIQNYLWLKRESEGIKIDLQEKEDA